jgi:hypothetical protein
MFTTEHLDWGASLVGEETKWRLAAVASKPFLSNKPPFCFLGDGGKHVQGQKQATEA